MINYHLTELFFPYYPFTPPDVNPPTIYFCNLKKSNIAGIATKIEPAANKLKLWFVGSAIKLFNPTKLCKGFTTPEIPGAVAEQTKSRRIQSGGAY